MESGNRTGSEIQPPPGEGEGGEGQQAYQTPGGAGAQATQASGSGPSTGGPGGFVELLPQGPGEPLALLSHSLAERIYPAWKVTGS